MAFLKLNLNPRERKVGDCVIRAIACATGKSWEEVYTALCEIGLEIKDVPTDKATYALYLERIGWAKMKMPKKQVWGEDNFGGEVLKNKRITVAEFAEINNKGRYVVDMANHLTAVEDGTIIDLWNCGHKSIGNWWVRREEIQHVKNLF